ncbi:MAG: hypothetical protein CMH83_08305 [Nocardioides sp.]|nr:hypothetical protein [Nocardioides sp.]
MTDTAHPAGETDTVVPAGAAAGRGGARRVLVEAAVGLATWAALGAAAGWLWQRLWQPPTGGTSGGRWLFDDWDSIGRMYGATGLFVLIGIVLGLVLGALGALVLRRSPLVTLVVLAVGSLLGAWLCHAVGTASSPPNPVVLALLVPDGTALDESMRVSGLAPWSAWPLGALVGASVVWLMGSSAADVRGFDLRGHRRDDSGIPVVSPGSHREE